MRATIKDIARECGISVSAVSMALSEKPNRISQATRQKVLDTAKRLNYQPNRAAVSLVNKKSRIIGIVVNDVRNTHIASLFMAINKAIEGKGYSMICHILDNEEMNSDTKLINFIASENVAALIWAKSLQTDKREELEMLKQNISMLGIPVITMDDYGFECPGTDVCFDYSHGAYLATKHLVQCGHKKIGCLAGDITYKVTKERIEGYQNALKEFGLPFREELLYYGDYTMEGGYLALSYLMGHNVSAVFSFNDEMAFGVYKAARNYGINIPKDLSIVGFDNVPFADVMEIPLSTVNVPIVEMGEFIGNKVMELLESDKKVPREKVIYKPDLLLRASTRKVFE